MAERPSMRDVAARAGTSTAVVSYVVNGGPRPVSAATRRRVEAAIDDLGYRPNLLARGLRAQRTGTFGLIVPDLARPFFAELAAGVQDAAFRRDRVVLLAATRFDRKRELSQIDALVDARVDGIALLPSDDHQLPLAALAQAGVDYVLGHVHVEGIATVVADDLRAGAEAAEHLASHGHTTIACLSGPPTGSPVMQRTAGFRRTLAARGLLDEHLIAACSYEDLAESAHKQTVQLLAARPDVTAVCATTDEHALGVMRAAGQLGRSIGADLALVAIDGTVQSEYLTPGLTVLRVPFEQYGKVIVDQLIGSGAQDVLQGAPAPLTMTLTRRQSCGCP